MTWADEPSLVVLLSKSRVATGLSFLPGGPPASAPLCRGWQCACGPHQTEGSSQPMYPGPWASNSRAGQSQGPRKQELAWTRTLRGRRGVVQGSRWECQTPWPRLGLQVLSTLAATDCPVQFLYYYFHFANKKIEVVTELCPNHKANLSLKESRDEPRPRHSPSLISRLPLWSQDSPFEDHQ